ncbi:MAG: hypothetical protein HY671_09435 [Chloroflexi bacterium]|nr:hypothetical protein [Chloroflexota bacterium]
MTKTYVHAPVNVTIGPEDRGYCLEEELLEHRGREVLCVHSKAGSCRFCDGISLSGLYTIFVKGYIVTDRYRISDNGEVVTEFQPIVDEVERREIEAVLREKWGTAQVFFD